MTAKQDGEWQEETNAFGGVRRYRMIGNVKEYEMDVTVDGITIPQSQLESYNRRKKAIEQARREAENSRPPQPKCPFMDGVKTDCIQEECALYLMEDGCALAWLNNRAPQKDTEGLRCPFNRSICRPECVLYQNGGCELIGIVKRIGDKNDS